MNLDNIQCAHAELGCQVSPSRLHRISSSGPCTCDRKILLLPCVLCVVLAPPPVLHEVIELRLQVQGITEGHSPRRNLRCAAPPRCGRCRAARARRCGRRAAARLVAANAEVYRVAGTIVHLHCFTMKSTNCMVLNPMLFSPYPPLALKNPSATLYFASQ